MNSIINQTYKELEIILVNDGSTDNSLDIINKYKDKDSRIRIFSNPNSGVSYTRNFGISVSTGEYISFVDADDVLNLNLYSTFCDILNSHMDADLIQCKYKIFSSDEELKEVLSDVKDLQVVEKDEKAIYENQLYIMDLKNNKKDMISISVWAKLYRASIIKENNMKFKETLHMFEDGIFTIEYLNFVKKAYMINSEFYFYRVVSNSSLTRKVDANKLAQNLFCVEYLKEFFKNKNIDYLNENAFIEFSFGSIMSYFKAYLFHKDCKLDEKERKRLFYEVYKNSDFINAVKKIDRKGLAKKYKTISLLVKLKSYYLVKLYYYNYYKNLNK